MNTLTPTEPGWWWVESKGQRWIAEVYFAKAGHWHAHLKPLDPSFPQRGWHATDSGSGVVFLEPITLKREHP